MYCPRHLKLVEESSESIDFYLVVLILTIGELQGMHKLVPVGMFHVLIGRVKLLVKEDPIHLGVTETQQVFPYAPIQMGVLVDVFLKLLGSDLPDQPTAVDQAEGLRDHRYLSVPSQIPRLDGVAPNILSIINRW
jgi:hypothetical protein